MQLAFYIGQSDVIDGTRTDMVAFANDDVFAQIWIGVDDKLPRRMRAVYRRDPLQLRHEMQLSNWQRAAARPHSRFCTALLMSRVGTDLASLALSRGCALPAGTPE